MSLIKYIFFDSLLMTIQNSGFYCCVHHIASRAVYCLADQKLNGAMVIMHDYLEVYSFDTRKIVFLLFGERPIEEKLNVL